VSIQQFYKIAPYLVNPLVLGGFCLFLLAGLHRALLKRGVLTSFSQRQSSTFVRMILKHEFLISFAIVILGFAYAAYRADHDTTIDRGRGVITQQAGDCGANVAGNGNSANVKCESSGAKTK
jgi:hypothetical protein